MRSAPMLAATTAWTPSHWFDGLGLAFGFSLEPGDVAMRWALFDCEVTRAAKRGQVRATQFATASQRGLVERLLKRTRWLQLHAAYIGAENQHDLPGILACFAPDASMVVNGRVVEDEQAIADLHTALGMSDAAAGLAGTQVIHDREYFTDDELLIHGRVLGTHVGRVLHFAPTFRQVELHYAALYRFGEGGKLVSERIVMNWGPLAGA